MSTNFSQYVNEWSTLDPADTKNAEDSGVPIERHEIEQLMANTLNSHPELHFDHLVVRRLSEGRVCLEGVLHSDHSEFNLDDYLSSVLGWKNVVNRVVTRLATTADELSDQPKLSDEDTVVDWQ